MDIVGLDELSRFPLDRVALLEVVGVSIIAENQIVEAA